MNNFLTYLAEVNLLLLLFASIYGLCFRNTPHHAANRILLNLFLCAAFIVPTLSTVGPPEIQGTVFLDPQVIDGVASTTLLETESHSFGLWHVYLAGAVVSLLFSLSQLPSLIRLLRKRRPHDQLPIFVVRQKGLAAGSFFRTVFLDTDLPPDEEKVITAHEWVHIREWHSLDLLIFRLAAIVCWFNPAVYFMQRHLAENHEFRADSLTTRQLDDGISYFGVLLSRNFGVANFPLHSFSNRNFLKQRIMMLTNPDRRKSKAFRYAFLPLLAVPVLFIHSCTKEPSGTSITPSELVATELRKLTEDDLRELTQINSDSVYTIAEVMPEFPGGMDGLIAYLTESIHYPEGAKAIGVATVYVSFVVDEHGGVTGIEVPQSPDPSLTAAAVDAVAGMPKWTPGFVDGEPVKVQYMLPIRFTPK